MEAPNVLRKMGFIHGRSEASDHVVDLREKSRQTLNFYYKEEK